MKQSKVRVTVETSLLVDSGYQGLQKIHAKTWLPNKRKKKQKLTKDQRRQNKELASARVPNENVIGVLKRFKIIADKYRNRRKRFGLRFNLIAAIYNMELLA